MREASLDNPGRNTVFLDLWKVALAFRGRVAVALACLVIAKLAVVSVPLVLKRIVDLLSRPEQIAALPVALLIGYALLRFS
ncbi:MAG: transporter ATP-binding protein/permease, partial [Noviherbaspirillum sp.]|nr:transporter ATP-binding protein/permease [Noviherbaspirillum sp.]